MAIEPVITFFRIRVVATYNSGNQEITNDLPHLHQAHYEVAAFQPGNPGSTALGSFTIPLHPPGTEGYAAAKPIYDQLDYVQRVELYGSPDGASLGKLYYAGVITEIRKSHGQNSTFELSGVSDLFWLNYSRPFPGEVLTVNYGSGSGVTGDYRQARHYFATQELGWSDTFSPFTIGNYTSTNAPALTSGTWTGTTDNGLNVASCTTGSGAVLISRSGAAPGCQYNRNFVEVSGRLLPSSDATNAGGCGVGLTASSANATTSLIAWIRAKLNGTTNHWDLDVIVYEYNASVLTQATVVSALTSVDDPDGYIPFTISLHFAAPTANPASFSFTASVAVNGKVIFGETGSAIVPGSQNVTTGTMFPLLFFATPATGSATAYLGNLVQLTRYGDDYNANLAIVKPGVIGTPLHTLPLLTEPGPTFLEVISRAAVREGWYWRYTPQPYVVGARTLGTMDFTDDPGTDRGTTRQVVFSQPDGTLLDLQLSANADQMASGTALSGPSGTDGAGIAYWRDVSTMSKYGVIEDQTIAAYSPLGELQRAANQIVSNKTSLGSIGSKAAIVLRDPQSADVWRELDKVMIHDPEIGINYLVARVIGYTFDEGQPSQRLTLDQFSVDDPNIPMRRLQQGVFQTAMKYGNR